MDEADTFAPQMLENRQQKLCLGTVSRLVKQGGIRGAGIAMISQRPADINKKVLSQVDMLTVPRMSHPLDMLTVPRMSHPLDIAGYGLDQERGQS